MIVSQAGHVLVSSRRRRQLRAVKLERPIPAAAVVSAGAGALVDRRPARRPLHAAGLRRGTPENDSHARSTDSPSDAAVTLEQFDPQSGSLLERAVFNNRKAVMVICAVITLVLAALRGRPGSRSARASRR